jgi:predicted RNase H-like nuclease
MSAEGFHSFVCITFGWQIRELDALLIAENDMRDGV